MSEFEKQLDMARRFMKTKSDSELEQKIHKLYAIAKERALANDPKQFPTYDVAQIHICEKLLGIPDSKSFQLTFNGQKWVDKSKGEIK